MAKQKKQGSKGCRKVGRCKNSPSHKAYLSSSRDKINKQKRVARELRNQAIKASRASKKQADAHPNPTYHAPPTPEMWQKRREDLMRLAKMQGVKYYKNLAVGMYTLESRAVVVD